MLEHQHRFRLQRMAAVFGVSRSGYYQWRRTGEEPGEKALRRAALDEKINKAFTQGKQRDGARRIQVALAENGDHADLKTILNSMKRQGLKAKAARKCEFRGRPATHFGVNRPVISASSGHPFRCDPVSRFGVIRPSFSFFVSGAAA